MHCIQATDSNLDIQLKWHDISADTDISMQAFSKFMRFPLNLLCNISSLETTNMPSMNSLFAQMFVISFSHCIDL